MGAGAVRGGMVPTGLAIAIRSGLTGKYCCKHLVFEVGIGLNNIEPEQYKFAPHVKPFTPYLIDIICVRYSKQNFSELNLPAQKDHYSNVGKKTNQKCYKQTSEANILTQTDAMKTL